MGGQRRSFLRRWHQIIAALLGAGVALASNNLTDITTPMTFLV